MLDYFPVKVPCQKYATTQSPNHKLGVEIYNGPLARRIRSVKLFSLSTSLMGLIAQPIIIERIMETGVSIVAMIFSGAVVQFFTFVTPVVLHYFTKKYVKVMYYDPETDTYSAVTHTFWATDKVYKPNESDNDETNEMWQPINEGDTDFIHDFSYHKTLGPKHIPLMTASLIAYFN
ncbi:mitochondrial proton-transporting ATP synthase complex assembly [Homalodisca vitripennis]|nr:mitochondrial proton-transporting ATP synthase complex assembly [Homalodisca vitripennis]